MRLLPIIAGILFLGTYSCKTKPTTPVNDQVVEDSSSNLLMQLNDPHSYSKPSECKVSHLDLDVTIDFDHEILVATAKWHLAPHKGNKVIFDTKGLEIEKVRCSDNKTCKYQLGSNDPMMGSALSIDISPETKYVSITYKTKPEAEALMWLQPEQTMGKTQPFMFTQSQAILARTWIPCQDGPGVRFTYNARVKTPKGLLAAMSATNPTTLNDSNIYHFEMKQPIPSYLMALVCGNLQFRSVGSRTGVYAEPELIDAAEYELGKMQTMLEKAEALYGPYLWERYDVVFLPPSFPFGGMENPRLTFATPTIITGDRSLTALIAHEMAHSWSGNLVTNATWNDFWLNEGFTVYFEQRIMEAVYGRDYSEMLALLSYQGLLDELEDFEKDSLINDTRLKLDLEGRNPDDAVSAIAYDKGYLFLRMLEENYGRTAFDAFLKQYFSDNAFKVMTTEKFVDYLNKNLLDTDKELAAKCKVEEWIYGTGLPANCPIIKSEKLAKIDQYINEYFLQANMDIGQIDTTGWTAHEYIYFVANLPQSIGREQMAVVDQYFHFTQSSNAEILGKWFQTAANHQYQQAYGAMEDFLISVGRRKFLTPIYKALCQTPEGWELAQKIYTKARPNYHAVSRKTIENLLEKTQPHSVAQHKGGNG
ncbi:aminopeptidase [bacterium]|nr:aminopeptidase [bacterium]